MGKIATYFTWRVIYGRIPVGRHVPTLVRCKTDNKEQTSVMSTFNVYVGSDNKTHKVDIERIQGVVMRMHQGFTIQRTTGSWHGTVEESAIVVIQDDYELVHRTARILKRELSQESVGFQQVSDIEYI